MNNTFITATQAYVEFDPYEKLKDQNHKIIDFTPTPNKGDLVLDKCGDIGKFNPSYHRRPPYLVVAPNPKEVNFLEALEFVKQGRTVRPKGGQPNMKLYYLSDYSYPCMINENTGLNSYGVPVALMQGIWEVY